MAIFHLDTETFRIRPGLQAPPIVCAQFAWDLNTPEVIHGKDPALGRVLRTAIESHTTNGHYVAFDAAVIGANFPDLQLPLFEAYHQDRMACTSIRHKLRDIARGCFRGRRGPDGKFFQQWGYTLAECVKRLCDVELDKSDPWRMAYGSLAHLPVAQWPEAAIRYAQADIHAQQRLWYAQEKEFRPGELLDQFRQARASFWIRLMECWGAKTDPEAVERYHAVVLQEFEEDRAILVAEGLVRRDGSKDTKRAMARMIATMAALEQHAPLSDAGERICKETGEDPATMFARTGKGICLDKDACEAAADPILDSYSRYGSLGTTLGKVERLRRGYVTPIQPSYESIVETGRTSCRQGEDPEADENGIIWEPRAWGSQMQNPPKKSESKDGKWRPGIRECFRARPGYVICSVDFDSFELKSWSQVCLWAVRRSRMAEVLNSGEDPHTDLGARILGQPRDLVRAGMRGAWTPAEIEAFKEGARQSAKPANFGFPGGMGAERFVASAWSLYRIRQTLQQAKTLRTQWKAEWPEAQEYFDWINWLVKRGGGLATIEHFVSKRIRGSIPYTVSCNSFFQGLAADAAKEAGWELARAMYLAELRSALYGSRTFGFVHDEFLAEIPERSPEHVHHAAYEMAQIMCDTAQRYIPDVKITATPALMYSWSKRAKTVHNKSGLLIPSDGIEAREMKAA